MKPSLWLPICLSAIAFAAGSALRQPATAQTAKQQIAYSSIVDLSHAIDANIPIWPGDPPMRFKTVATIKKEGYFLRELSIGEHSATHINAGNSFFAGGLGIDALPTNSLVHQAVVIDVRQQTKQNADYQLSVTAVQRWEAAHGQIPIGAVVILWTGWQGKWGNAKAFFNQDTKGNLHFPGFGLAATKFLLEQREIAGVGTDTHGADPGLDTSYATNNAVLRRGGIVLECLTNLDQLPATGATLVLGPLKLLGDSTERAGIPAVTNRLPRA